MPGAGCLAIEAAPGALGLRVTERWRASAGPGGGVGVEGGPGSGRGGELGRGDARVLGRRRLVGSKVHCERRRRITPVACLDKSGRACRRPGTFEEAVLTCGLLQYLPVGRWVLRLAMGQVGEERGRRGIVSGPKS